MMERLTGVKWPSDNPDILNMANLIQTGDKAAAAAIAIGKPQFINVLVREMAGKLSTREETVREPLNEFTAGFMGLVRDGTDFREILHGNFLYKADPALLPAGAAVPADTIRNNNHYAALERLNVDVGGVLMRVNGQQIANSNNTVVNNPDPAGVLTSRTWIAAHAVAGTNRRLVEYTFRQFMCIPISGWSDPAAPDTRIGRDIDRAPGGVQETFLTTCKACHTVMDGFRGAFAKWDFGVNAGAALHSANAATQANFVVPTDAGRPGIVRKMNRNDFVQYAGGYITTDDSFINNANRGLNATRFGWRDPAPDTSPLAGVTTGAHAFGRLVAGSRRFSQCMAKHAWDAVCKHQLSDADMDTVMVGLGVDLESQGYNMKKLFEAVAAHPKCKI